MKKESKKRMYVRPECIAFPVETESLCQASIVPKVPGSTEEKWKNDEDVDGGEMEI